MTRSRDLVEKWAKRGALSPEAAAKFTKLVDLEKGEAVRRALREERTREEREAEEARARALAERQAQAVLDEQYLIEERQRETGERWNPPGPYREGIWTRPGETIAQAQKREREAAEAESDDPSAPTVVEVNGTRRILRGCFVCGVSGVQRYRGLIGFNTLGRMSGYLCRACRKVWDSTTLSMPDLAKRRLKAEGYPTTNPTAAIWGLRLADRDLELAALQVPVSKPFGFLQPPRQDFRPEQPEEEE